MYNKNILSNFVIISRNLGTFLRLFHCVVCKQYVNSPMKTCTMGHNFCIRCLEKISRCPVCISRPNSQPKIPCMYRRRGCTAQLVESLVRNHEMECMVRWKPCPLIPERYCTWIGPARSIYQHCAEIHHKNTAESHECDYTWEDIERALLGACVKTLYYKDNMIFLCTLSIRVCLPHCKDVIVWSVKLLGGNAKPIEYNFFVEVELTHENTGRNTIVRKIKNNSRKQCGMHKSTMFNVCKSYDNDLTTAKFKLRIVLAEDVSIKYV